MDQYQSLASRLRHWLTARRTIRCTSSTAASACGLELSEASGQTKLRIARWSPPLEPQSSADKRSMLTSSPSRGIPHALSAHSAHLNTPCPPPPSPPEGKISAERLPTQGACLSLLPARRRHRASQGAPERARPCRLSAQAGRAEQRSAARGRPPSVSSLPPRPRAAPSPSLQAPFAATTRHRQAGRQSVRQAAEQALQQLLPLLFNLLCLVDHLRELSRGS